MTANNAITDADEALHLLHVSPSRGRAERIRSLARRRPAAQRGRAGRDAGRHGITGRRAGWGRLLTGLGPVRETRTPRRRGPCWPAGTGTWPPGRRRRCFTHATCGRSPRRCTVRCSGAETWTWMTSGALAPTLSMVRRWLGNDTLGAARRAGATGRGGRERTGRNGSSPRLPGALAAAWAAAVKAGGARPRASGGGATRHRAVRAHPLGGAFPGAAMGGDADTIQAGRLRVAPGQPVHGGPACRLYRQVVGPSRSRRPASFVIPWRRLRRPGQARTSPTSFARWAVHQRIPMSGAAGRVGRLRSG